MLSTPSLPLPLLPTLLLLLRPSIGRLSLTPAPALALLPSLLAITAL
jgi:hypothetical protein